ncbi:transmembrane amino acid transporter protein-domain-containing protein [Suillus ampliporus]|nr:transmembrane amino acid transporter protein-domain-containing protein [Suillus ampliporus]
MAFQPAAVEAVHDHLSEKEEQDSYVPEINLLPDGTTPNIETYMYFAKIQRDREALSAKNDAEDGHRIGLFSRTFKRSQGSDDKRSAVSAPGSDEKKGAASSKQGGSALVTEGEYRAASGALRTATWGNVFYLITTDILGPYSTPWVFQQVGYGPGVACFFVFGIMAAYSGFLLWWMFLKLDSDRYPVKSFGELGQRIYGRWFRYVCNILQCVQLVFIVGLIILANGQGLSQMAKFNLCFSVCNVVWTIAGMILGQIRTLQKFGSIANLAIWMNIITLIMTMASVANSGPNYNAVKFDGPVQTHGIYVQPFQAQLNGIMQIVYSYGGAMIFVEFMAEMRRPMDFWKAMVYAQIFIFIVYMFFGLFVYSYQGQYVVNPANQGISAYALQTATNAISLTAGLIAAALFGNIGVKVIYNSILVEMAGFPDLTVVQGKYYFSMAVIVYWSIAFVIGSAVPQFSNISSLMAAVCTFQFTYTFPPFMILGYCMQVDATKGDIEFDINNPHAHRVDTWKQTSRWKRAFFTKNAFFNVWNFLLTLACLACAILSGYSAIKSIVTGFNTSGSASSFGCHSPLDNA